MGVPGESNAAMTQAQGTDIRLGVEATSTSAQPKLGITMMGRPAKNSGRHTHDCGDVALQTQSGSVTRHAEGKDVRADACS